MKIFHSKLRFIAISAAFLFLLAVPRTTAQTVTFDDSDPETMIIDNGTAFKVGLSKTSGAFHFIIDRLTGDTLCHGSRDNALWEASFLYRFKRDIPEISLWEENTFSYSWSSSENTLTMNYIPDPLEEHQVTVTIDLVVSTGSWFDMKMTLENHWGEVIKTIWFPNNLDLRLDESSEALMPLMYPGMMLEGGFFRERVEMIDFYPGLLQSDYMGFKINDSRMSIYTLRDGLPIRFTFSGLTPFDYPGYNLMEGNKYHFVHQYPVWTENDSTWTSPVTRFRINESYLESLKACRTDNGLDAFPSLEEKLGNKYDSIVRSPMFCMYFGTVNPSTFKEVSEFMDKNPDPALILISGSNTGGFGQGLFPDVDVDPRWGTTEDFKDLIRLLHDQGKMVMLFTQFGGVEEGSVTFQNLMEKTTVEEFAAIDTSGNPVRTTKPKLVGDTIIEVESGYVTSPLSSFLIEELDKQVETVFNEYGCDVMYQDGGRGMDYDFNHNLPTPVGGKQAWLEQTRQYDNYLQVLEGFCDRKAETCEGLMNSMRKEFFGAPDEIGNGVWRHYPANTILYHDKVIPYLTWGLIIRSKYDLSYYLAFGAVLQATLEGGNFEGDDWGLKPWTMVTMDFQQQVMSRILGKQMTDFTELDHFVTASEYKDISVIVNWDSVNSYVFEEHILSPEGAYAYSHSGDLQAGIFNRYNNQDLTEGDHFLIVRTEPDTIYVYHTMGEDTPLTVDMAENWNSGDTFWAVAFDEGDHIISSLPTTVASGQLTFNYMETLEGQHVAYYKIYPSSQGPDGSWEYFFNDFWRERILLGTRTYEIYIERPAGGINYVLDKRSGDTLSLISNPIWEVKYLESPGMVRMTNSNNFDSDYMYDDYDYKWSEEDKTLQWIYESSSDTTHNVEGVFTLNISNQEYFDMKIELQNNLGFPMTEISYPHNINFLIDPGDQIYLPLSYPGMKLDGSFLIEKSYFESNYPGFLAADYIAVDHGNSPYALYSINGDMPVRCLVSGFHKPWSEVSESAFFHKYPVFMEDGASWNSPVFRFTIGKEHTETLASYRTENGIDIYPSLQQKLGGDYSILTRSPLFNSMSGLTFDQFNQAAEVTGSFPKPSLIKLDCFHSGECNRHHPDYYPPRQDMGSTEEYRQMILDIQDQGHKIMPGIKPVWWNEDSQTMQNLSGSLTIDDISVLDIDSQPVTYWSGPLGYIVSPYHPVVQQKIEEIFTEFKDTCHYDLVYEETFPDFGIRVDRNPSAPTAESYYEGWLEHLVDFKDAGIITTTGYDRQAEFAWGFTGTGYQRPEEVTEWDNLFGSENWEVWPVTALLWHDKVFQYQYGNYTTINKEMLAWNLTFGCMLNFFPNVDEYQSLESPWLRVIEDFQQSVVSELACKHFSQYEQTEPDITLSTFEDYTVVRNWNNDSEYNSGDHTVSPGGALVKNSDGTLTAGIFSGYNGGELAGEEHYLIELRTDTLITILHSMGDDTPIKIKKLPVWTVDSLIQVLAIIEEDSVELSRNISDSYVEFEMESSINGKEVSHFIIFEKEQAVIVNNDDLPEASGIQLQNHPNPFRHETIVSLQMSRPDYISLKVYNLYGQEVATLVQDQLQDGAHTFRIDGSKLTAGTYYLRLKAGDQCITRKIVLLK